MLMCVDVLVVVFVGGGFSVAMGAVVGVRIVAAIVPTGVVAVVVVSVLLVQDKEYEVYGCVNVFVLVVVVERVGTAIVVVVVLVVFIVGVVVRSVRVFVCVGS